MFGSPPEVAAVGADFGSLARYDGNHATAAEPPGQADLARLLRDRGRRPDGRQVDSVCRPLPGGGIVATHREHRPSHDALIDPGLTMSFEEHVGGRVASGLVPEAATEPET